MSTFNTAEIVASAFKDVLSGVVNDSAKRFLTAERVDAFTHPMFESLLVGSAPAKAPSAPSAPSAPKAVETAKDKRAEAKAKTRAKGYISVPAATPNILEGSGTNPELDPDRVAEGVAAARAAVAEWYKTAPIPCYKNWTRQARLPGLFTGLANKLDPGGLVPHIRSNVQELAGSPEALQFFIDGANIVIDEFVKNGASELVGRANAIGNTFDQALSALV